MTIGYMSRTDKAMKLLQLHYRNKTRAKSRKTIYCENGTN